MRKIYSVLFALLAVVLPSKVVAQETTTTPTVVTMDDLVAMNIGVTDEGDGVYTVGQSITLSADYSLKIYGAKKLYLEDGVEIELEGYADFDATGGGQSPDARVVITQSGLLDAPKGIKTTCDGELERSALFKNIDFEYAQLKGLGAIGFDVIDCSFRYGNSALASSGAISLGGSGASFLIKGSTFESNTCPAIGGAANYYCGVTIEDCTFYDNNTDNTNKPQLNITVGGTQKVIVRNCKLEGTGRSKVGGIAVSNFMGDTSVNEVIIEGCEIKEHRYGITGMGTQNMIIRNNTLLNNNHETNPNSGGSGISLYRYYSSDIVNAKIYGNHIENHLWGITLINCSDINCGQIGNAECPGGNTFVNNGNGGVLYDLYNNSSSDVWAQNNTWNVSEQTDELIETVIVHKKDNSSLGEVFYSKDAGVDVIEVNESALTYANGVVSAAGEIKIYDIMGREVAAGQDQVSTENLNNGVYVARSAKDTIKFVVE